jgi:hypothetical protein
LKKSLDAILGDLMEREKERERGTWKQKLRQRYAPWFDDLVYGFELKEGWKVILGETMQSIERAVGDPRRCPDMRITRLKQEFGELTFQVRGLSDEQREAVNDVMLTASERSLRTCEWCGRPGSVRELAGNHWRTACDQHAVRY